MTAGWASVKAAPAAWLPADAAAWADLAWTAAWCSFAYHLRRRTNDRSVGLRRMASTFGPVLLLGLLLGLFQHLSLTVQLALDVAELMLLEDLYRHASDQVRWHLRMVCLSLGVLAAFGILRSANSLLFLDYSPVLSFGQVAVAIVAAPLLALGAARNRGWNVDIHISRTAALHSVTLAASGIFLLAMAVIGELVRTFGLPATSIWSGVAEVSLLVAGLLTTLLMLASASARGAVRRLLVDHFFTHRFDYRREWLRCIQTLSGPDHRATGLATRILQAVAQVVDSPGAALLLREPGTQVWRWEASWQMPVLTAPLLPDHPLDRLLAGGAGVTVLPEDVRRHPPLDRLGELWLGIPLPATGSGGQDACILTAPPRSAFQVDDEVKALLGVLGQEGATYLAEQRATRMLAQTRDLREYGQRFAFVAHDIKNLSGQLSLLLSNADRHLANPAFQSDMLATIRASVEKIGALIARLEPGGPSAATRPISPGERLGALVASVGAGSVHSVLFEQDGPAAEIAIAGDAFDALITHLVTNAAEASALAGATQPVRVVLWQEGDQVMIDVVDAGPGMAPEFVRDELFRPLATSKQGGSGIGAFQARELVWAAGGELIVLTQPGKGTTMRILLPCAERGQLAAGVLSVAKAG